MSISIIIPTLQAGRNLPNLLEQLLNQSCLPAQIIIIDSSSSDETIAIAEQFGCLVHQISRAQFRHGRARNLGARLAQGDILVFLTQDVLPANLDFLAQLTLPILEGAASAVYARQIPYPDAHPIEKLSRQFNYPNQSNRRTAQDLPILGIKAAFFSNSGSAFSSQAFWELSGFSEDVIVDEDLELSTRLLKAGYSVAYQAGAVLYHSHNYRYGQLFKRYFDIGVFFNQAQDLLKGISLHNEGFRYLINLAKGLAAQGEYRSIPRLILEAGVKYLAYQAGSHYPMLPLSASRKFSGQPHFWDDA